MSILIDIRDSWIEIFKSALKIPIVAREGRFDLAEVKRVSARLPAGFLTLIAIDSPSAGVELPLQISGILRWGLFIATDSASILPRGDEAISLVESAFVAIKKTASYSERNTRAISSPRAESLFSSELDTSGISIWLVSWTEIYDFFSP